MSEITTEIRTIGPEEANALLAKNIDNRKTMRTQVVRLAAYMLDGEWKFDASPIRIAKDGRLLDGQHRLRAVVESGTTQQFLVVSGLDGDSQATMDTGAKRSLQNMLEMTGETNATHLAAVVNASYKWANGARGSQIFHGSNSSIAAASIMSPSIPRLLDWLDQHPELRDVVKPGNAVARTLLAPPSVINFTYWVLRDVDYDDAEHFYQRLQDGAGLPAGSPILALRNRLIEMYREGRDRGHRPSYELGIALIFKAWNAYRDGREITRLYFKPGGANPESFPEPH